MRPVPVVLRPIAFTLQLSVKRRKKRNATSVIIQTPLVRSIRVAARVGARNLSIGIEPRASRARNRKTYIYACARTGSRSWRTWTSECGTNACRICDSHQKQSLCRQSSLSNAFVMSSSVKPYLGSNSRALARSLRRRTRTVGTKCATCFCENRRTQYPFLSYPCCVVCGKQRGGCVDARALSYRPERARASALAAGMKNEISRWGLFDESHVELDMLGIFSDDRLVL